MSKSFFSYSRADQDFALKLANDLRKNGVDLWFDQLDIPTGALWDLEIEKALKECETLIVIVSTSSVKSKNVLDEISFAIEEDKKIIPIKITSCEIPFRIRRLQYIDFNTKDKLGLDKILSILNPKNRPTKPRIEIPQKKGLNKWYYISPIILVSFLVAYLSFYHSSIGNKKVITIAIDSLKKSPSTIDTNYDSEKINSNVDEIGNKQIDKTKTLIEEPIRKIVNNNVSEMPFQSEFHYNTFYYTGPVKSGKPHGLGSLVDRNAKGIFKVFIGNFFDGKAKYGELWTTSGLGTSTPLNYIEYDGELVSGKPSGNGKKYSSRGALLYDGQFENGDYSGKGKLYENNSLIYDGNWKLGSKDGFGVSYLANGYRHEANYQNGKLNGPGKEYRNNKLHFDGIWINNLLNGYGVMYYDNGDKYEGDWKDDLRTGWGTYTWANGEKHIGYWFQNKQDGNGKRYNASGKIYQEGLWQKGNLVN
jgi:hypothetical protein